MDKQTTQKKVETLSNMFMFYNLNSVWDCVESRRRGDDEWKKEEKEEMKATNVMKKSLRNSSSEMDERWQNRRMKEDWSQNEKKKIISRGAL